MRISFLVCTFGLEVEDVVMTWRHNGHIANRLRQPTPFPRQGAMRFTTAPKSFAYGWVHRALPDIDCIALSRNRAYGGKIRPHGSAGFVRARGSEPVVWTLLEGTRLSFAGEELHRSEGTVVRVEPR